MQKITISNKTELAKSAIDNNAAMIFTIAALNKGFKKNDYPRLTLITFLSSRICDTTLSSSILDGTDIFMVMS